ncbi:AAA family ATPase [Ruminococcus sp.]|uniref:AAA family ATPase n=1 Tax=Ruminococcus sp. TaxID=41978 RepID=UPI0025E8FCF9|nr:AAA family ATPase [Ruminococcus sp.]
MSGLSLSDEQEYFVTKALEGHNILVDACIGSGKTTAIQLLCGRLPKDKKILYLTYNKLLKIDAKTKIKVKNATVTNYHGFAFMCLKRIGINAGVNDMISLFNENKPPIYKYDVLIIDEYQDIKTEFAEMLEYVKSTNPQMQIIAVGDMHQKIYDDTNLKVSEFINQFLGNHIKLEFTKCFRISEGLAAELGRIWRKKIVGVNSQCIVENMNADKIVDFLAAQDPKDILCLGSRNGALSRTLNKLEADHSDIFNKATVYASISENDSLGTTQPSEKTAIFTTFDSSKGLERKICVVFDYTESYWQLRVAKPQQSYEILRNIFCVAASRGKERIIFVDSNEAMLSESTLSTPVDENLKMVDMDISAMFDFKYREDIEKCFSLLNCKLLPILDNDEIAVKKSDGMIDLSPCIGIYQEAMYFDQYDIDKDIELYMILHPDKKDLWNDKVKKLDLESKILFFVSLETNQERYRSQVELPFVTKESENLIADRLYTKLKKDEDVQVGCYIDIAEEKDGLRAFSARGYADVVKDNIVYELKFVSELSHEHFLQCACYIVALELEKGILWNTRNNKAFEVTVPNKEAFLDAVVNTITKNKIHKYYKPFDIKEQNNVPNSIEHVGVTNKKYDVSDFSVGTKIVHKTFGVGTIIKITKEKNNHIIKVVLENGVPHNFLLEYTLKSRIITKL